MRAHPINPVFFREASFESDGIVLERLGHRGYRFVGVPRGIDYLNGHVGFVEPAHDVDDVV